MEKEPEFAAFSERMVDKNYKEYAPVAQLGLPVDRVPDDI
jgi:hypothetical protein